MTVQREPAPDPRASSVVSRVLRGILELQVGWFAQFGRPLYTAPVHLTESVSKSVVALGASMLNYYMYVGGTTFPFWGCRGNIWDIHPRGTGTTKAPSLGSRQSTKAIGACGAAPGWRAPGAGR